MAMKEKLIGLILIIIGILPFLLKIKSVSDSLAKYTFLSYLAPGEIIYQLIIIALGVWLIWKRRVIVRR
jgi:heme/copper-type cytochrome/quinol oxidase subunit 4